MKVLLVEPDKLLAEIYVQALQSAGHKVKSAATAQEAIAAADEIQPDLVIVELQLVEHSGIEFLYEFRSYGDWQAIPAIVHSLVPPAEFNQNQKVLRQELGVTHYLYKPQTSLDQLIETVEQQLLTPA